MPTLYFSLSNPHVETKVQSIVQECQLSLEAKCMGLGNTKDFSRETILKEMPQCDALIIVIEMAESSTEWHTLPVSESFLSQRLRFEITTAINLDIKIVPVLLDGAVLPERENLQGVLKHLCDQKSYKVRSPFLQEDLQEALDDIEEELDLKQEVEEKLSLSVEENFQRLSGYDAKPDKPANLESSSPFDLRKVVESETIFLKKARGIGDRKAEKNALSVLGMAYSRLGQTLKAIDFFLQELEIAKELGDSEDQCNLLANLGDAYAISGQLNRAQKYFEEQKALAQTKGYIKFIGSSYNGLGFIYVKQNKIEKAIDCYLKALTSYRKQADHDKELELLVGIGLNHQKLAQWEQATSYFTQALKVAKYVENRKEESHILIDLAESYYQLRDTKHFQPILDQADQALNNCNTSWALPLISRLNILKNSFKLH
jgi:tetratricopeptide (TPR) repeat protein